jgi:protein ImuB
VHLPWLPAENALIRKAAPPDAPFALIEKQRGALRIAALSRPAATLGLTPGMPLADARAQLPDLAALPFDPEADAALLGQLVALAHAYSPSVMADLPQGLILDIAGCTHFFVDSAFVRAERSRSPCSSEARKPRLRLGTALRLRSGRTEEVDGEAGLKQDLLTTLATKGLTARAACAGTPDAARALARFGASDVHALPVAALAVPPDIHLALQRSGLRRIGDLAVLPRAPLAARFGTSLPVLLARLLEEEDPHITPAPVIDPVAADLRFAEPIGRSDDVLDAIEALLADAAGQLERRGQGGRAFALSLHRSDGHIARLHIETGAPTRDPALVLRLLRERIGSLADPLDPGFGYDSIGLRVPVTEPLAVRQTELEGRETRGSALGPLLDRLAVRYGRESVQGFVPGNSHVPERAAWLGLAGVGTPWSAHSEPGEPPLRPLTLLDPPQPVEVLAAVPDGPPRRFRWRGKTHLVTRQEGPERIAAEWWLRRGGHGANPGRTRDYYRVEDADGHRFWLFRHGLYEEEGGNPLWYVHGLFA